MNTSCSVELLESALAGELPPEREGLLHRHLRECEACAAALEQMAGGEAGCREVAELLTADDLDDALSGYPHAGGDEWSNVDFTVEHLEPADEPGVLGRLGGYDVLEIIGRGGMGIVLKAFDRELKRCVAIKVLSPHLAQSSLAKKRFAREAQAAAAVVHPNVLAIHQVQPGGRLPFLVMPLVAGESLAQRLTAQGRLELKEILRIGMQAAAGLSAAHEQGLVHRDVKPANILLEKGVERAVLTDFGLARAADDVSMTRWGIIAGTPQYMSPEQARGEPLDGRSDLFSLGCILYEMATGVSPFRADSTLATLRRLIDDPPPAMVSHDPELPPWFVGIVERLLEKEPTRRFGSAKEVSELLEGCLAHLQQPASVPLPAGLPVPPVSAPLTPEPPAATARSNSRMRRTLFKGTLAMIATVTIAFLSMFAMQATSPPDISGHWQGEDWGQVTLNETAPGVYTGTYTDTVAKEKEPGKIKLKWSRIERRFNGIWSEGEDRFGDLSIRLADKEICGALTTDAKSKINPATPRLADLRWSRGTPAQNHYRSGTRLKPVAGPFYALQFDGNASSYVDIADPNGLPTGMSGRTLAVWFKLPNVDKVFGEDMGMLIMGYGPNSPGLRFSLAMNRNRIGAETCLLGAMGPWKPDTNWHHLAAVVPEHCTQMGQVLVYLDGARLPNVSYPTTENPDRTGQTPTGASKPFDTVGRPLKIGGVPAWNCDQAFEGSLSETRVYDRALSSDEIAVLHADPARATNRGLVAGYHFDEGSGSVAHDFSGHGNTGTLKGDVKWVPGEETEETVPGTAPGAEVSAEASGTVPPRNLGLQRIATLEALVPTVKANFISGLAKLSDLYDAQDKLLDAQLEAAKSKTERVAIWERLLKSRQDFEKMAEARLKTGAIEGSQADFLRAQAERQKAELRVAEEKARDDMPKEGAMEKPNGRPAASLVFGPVIERTRAEVVTMLRPGESAPPATEAERAIARLVLVFREDRLRRATPAVLVNAGSRTLIVTTGPAVVVPDGAPPAIDRSFLELPGRPAVKAQYTPDGTKELFAYRAEGGLTGYRPDGKVVLEVGDVLSAIISGSSPEFSVASHAARVAALGRQTTLSLPRPLTPVQHYDRLVEVDRSLPEGTPLFKEGKLAGLVLLGSRFLGEASNKSYVVPVDRIAALCSRLEAGNGPSSDSTQVAPAKAAPGMPN